MPHDNSFLPIGVVSNGYVLSQHFEVTHAVADALVQNGVPAEAVHVDLTLTENGERMELSVFLPERFRYRLSDDNYLDLRLECFNSVDGSMRFQAVMGWLSFVCSNGLVVGITHVHVKRRHVGHTSLAELGLLLHYGIAEAENEKERLDIWTCQTAEGRDVDGWADGQLRKAWGFKAAARALHIIRTGFDGSIDGDYRKHRPSSIPVRSTRRVPGARCDRYTLYDSSQALAWLAKERTDVREQLDWRAQIPELVNAVPANR